MLDTALLKCRRFFWRALNRPGPPPGVTLSDAQALFGEGELCNDQGDHQRALEIAQTLKAWRFTGAYEIEAKARHASGDTEGGIAAIREGLGGKPVWRNGHLLGVLLSEEGRYEEALAALDASLGMHEPQYAQTMLDKAIVLDRAGRRQVAIELLADLVERPAADEHEEDVYRYARDFIAEMTLQAAGSRRRRGVARPRR